MKTIADRINVENVGGFCMIIADQCNKIRKLKVAANDANMQLSVEPRHHLRDWDQADHEESSVPRDSLSDRANLRIPCTHAFLT